MSTCIERGFYLTSLQPKYTGLLRPIGIGENFLLGLRILSNLRPSLLPSSLVMQNKNEKKSQILNMISNICCTFAVPLIKWRR